MNNEFWPALAFNAVALPLFVFFVSLALRLPRAKRTPLLVVIFLPVLFATVAIITATVQSPSLARPLASVSPLLRPAAHLLSLLHVPSLAQPWCVTAPPSVALRVYFVVCYWDTALATSVLVGALLVLAQRRHSLGPRIASARSEKDGAA